MSVSGLRLVGEGWFTAVLHVGGDPQLGTYVDVGKKPYLDA